MQRVTGEAETGNITITTGGVASTTIALGSFPAATISVYLTGTNNLAVIYSDNGVTLKANPFTAASDGSWFFYAANGRYDLTIVGTAGDKSVNRTIGDILLNDFASVTVAPSTVAFSATPVFDLNVASWFIITLTGNVTAPTFPNVVNGSFLYMTIKQDGTGGRTFVWPGTFLRPPTIASQANAVTELTFKYDGTNWRVQSASGDNTQLRVANNIRFADQFGLTDAGIQAAINDCPDGGCVDLGGNNTYVITGTITISKRITIRGGGRATVLQVGASVGATTDVFLLKPSTSTDVNGMRFENFYITPASGTPARSAFMIDGTNASVSNLVIDQVKVDTLGSYAFNIQNVTGVNSATNGTPFLLTIRDCEFNGGVNLTKAGDSINLLNNKLGGARDLLISQIGAAATDGGAHGLMILNNNITQTGGIVIQNAWQGLFAYNDVEQPVASTEANSALLDIQGNASANVQNFKVVGNYLGATTGNVTDTIRVDRATGTEISRNYAVRSTGVTYRITANAVKTHIAYDRQAPDSALSAVLADLGTATLVEYISSASSIASFYPQIAITNSSGTGLSTISHQFKANPTSGVFAFSSGDPTATAVDTAAWRGAANQWVFGNAYGDTSGGILYTQNGQVETAAPSGIAGRTLTWADSTAHRLKMNNNNGGALTIAATSGDTFTNTTLTGPASGNSITLLNSQDATGAITGDGTDKTIYTYSLPANTMQAGKGICIQFQGLNGSAAATTYKIKFGATTVWTGVTAAATDAVWAVTKVSNNAGVQNAQHTSAMGFAAAVATGNGATAPAENTANAVTILVTANVANPNTFSGKGLWIELIQ